MSRLVQNVFDGGYSPVFDNYVLYRAGKGMS
jgi:hypothetical protein